jgi:hypothetical protein
VRLADLVTEQMIGSVLERARTAGADGRKAKSLATQDQIRSPLRRFFREMIRKHGLPGPNPCDDLKDYMSKVPSKRARQGKLVYFAPAPRRRAFRVSYVEDGWRTDGLAIDARQQRAGRPNDSEVVEVGNPLEMLGLSRRLPTTPSTRVPWRQRGTMSVAVRVLGSIVSLCPSGVPESHHGL